MEEKERPLMKRNNTRVEATTSIVDREMEDVGEKRLDAALNSR